MQKVQSVDTCSLKVSASQAAGSRDAQSRRLTSAAGVQRPLPMGVQPWAAWPAMPVQAATSSPDAFVVSPIVDLDSVPASPSPATEVDERAMEAWASGPTVLAHAHSDPATEPYALSSVEEFGGGMLAPEGWSLASQSSLGLKSSQGENQDAFSHTLMQSGWVFSVVCDGHGQQGEVVAERVARTVPFFLSQHVCDLGFEKALPEAFHLAQKDLERNFSPMQAFSGATVAVSCIHHVTGEAWVAHAGDSTIVLGDLETGVVAFQTEEHKAHSPEEAERLQVGKAQVISQTHDDGEVTSRVYIPTAGVPGLSMSRSLGDGCLKKYGVVATPEVRNVTEFWQSCAAPVALLGSDGLFDFTKAEEVVSTLAAHARKGRPVEKSALTLIRQAQHRWIEEEEDYCDDITCLIVGPEPKLDLAQ